MSDGYLTRLNYFFNERFPLSWYGVGISISLFALHLFWASIVLEAAIFASWVKFAALISHFIFILLLRIIDEFKDRQVDKTLFPNRCLPSKKVYYRDIYYLSLALLAIWIPLNFFVFEVTSLFLFLLIFVYLFSKSFFFPESLRKSLLLEFVLNSPINLFGSFYLLAIFSSEQNINIFDPRNFKLALAFWLSAMAWETARKIRRKEQETQYVTYSKVLGPIKASMIPLGTLGVQALLFTGLAASWNNQQLFGASITILYSLYCLSFLLVLNDKRLTTDKRLKLTTEIYLVLQGILLISFSLMVH